MKNLIRSIIACITVSIVLSSCGQKLSLTKRHYRNGYHVSHTKKANATPKRVNDNSTDENIKMASNKKAVISTKTILPTNEVAKNTIQTDNITPPLVKAKSYISKPAAVEKPSDNFVTTAKQMMTPKKFIDNTLKFKKENLRSAHDGDGHGHSLLWLLIVILLILWLLGFAGGYLFGGLIHLIIVVAVILFILWLLRIV